MVEVIEVDPVASFTKIAGGPLRTDRESTAGAPSGAPSSRAQG